jgi:hypothetical protein
MMVMMMVMLITGETALIVLVRELFQFYSIRRSNNEAKSFSTYFHRGECITQHPGLKFLLILLSLNNLRFKTLGIMKTNNEDK